MEPDQDYQTFEAGVETGVRVWVVTLRQVMDDAAARLRRELLHALDEPGPDRVVLCLSRVSYVSSAGIGALIALLKRVRETGGRLVLCGLSTQTEQVLRICQLIGEGRPDGAPVFPTAPDVAAAVAQLGAGG
jgi:stage II sporulation protein AA (anti-sigma F factor antagonist)